MKSISTINAMTEDEFVDVLGGVYESSPWVVKRAYRQAPFSDFADLQKALAVAVDAASAEQQYHLIVAHPDLGGKLAREGQLTEESTREQSRLGLEHLSGEEFEEFDRLNREYKKMFGIPFIICVGLVEERAQILLAFRQRLGNPEDVERREALRQIHLIAGLRLSALIEN
jgi:OHCU decarboxylase